MRRRAFIRVSGEFRCDRSQVSRVRAASVEVEEVICEQHPREVVVGTAVRLTLPTDRQTDALESCSHGNKEDGEKPLSYSDCGAEVVRALMETGHVERPLVFSLQESPLAQASQS